MIHFAGLKTVGESVEKMPDLKELHADGAYGSEDNDKKFEELGITHIQTAVRGRKNKVDLKIEETKEGKYEVTCPRQKVNSEKVRIRYKACFDKGVCGGCSLVGDCPTLIQKLQRVYYFDREQYLANRRKRNIDMLFPERKIPVFKKYGSNWSKSAQYFPLCYF